MERGFSPSSLSQWLLNTFHDHNLDDVVILNKDGTLSSENPHVVDQSGHYRVFSRQVSAYVEQQKNLLEQHFVKTYGITRELRKLESYAVELRSKNVILKKDLCSGSLSFLTSTLLSSPVLELLQIKDDIFHLTASSWSKTELNEGLMKLYDCLYGLYKKRLITIKGFFGILAELPGDIESRLCNVEGDSMNNLGMKQKLVVRYVQDRKYDLALLKLVEPYQDIMLSEHNFKLYDFVRQSPTDQIEQIIADDAQMIADFRACMDAMICKRPWSEGRGFNAEKSDMYLRSGKRVATNNPKMSVAESKHQLRLMLSAKQEKKSGMVQPPANPVDSQIRLAEMFRRLYKVCQALELDSARCDQILALDFQGMSVETLEHALRRECGLDEHKARLILECVKTPNEIDAVISQRESTEPRSRQSGSVIACPTEHELTEQEVVVILPDSSVDALVAQDHLENIRLLEVPDEPVPVAASRPLGEVPCYPEITQELLANTLIEEIVRECPAQFDDVASIIRKHLGNISLNQRHVYNVMRGDKRTINQVFERCQMQEKELQEEMELVQKSTAAAPPVINVDAQTMNSTTLVRGEVVLRICAGIQASDNNCGLAAFFMSISNNGLLDQLIQDAEHRVAVLLSLNDIRARSLNHLVDLLKHFNTGGDLDKYIPNAGLDDIRLRYRLRVARVYPEVIAEVFTNNEDIVTLTVASQFHGGADLKTSNRNAFVAFECFWQDAGLSAVVRVLPSISLGVMQIKGVDLSLGQRCTMEQLKELEFVPLGEFLEPIEFILPILNEIYDLNNTESGQANIFSMWQKSTTSFKQKVSVVDMQGDCQTERTRSIPSKNFPGTITEEEDIPENFILDPTKTVLNPHPFMDNVVGSSVEHYFLDNVLRLKLTVDLHHNSQDETRRTYEFYDENGLFEKKTIYELEKYFADESITFVRAKDTEFIGDQGERKRIELRMFGYSAERPHEGEVKIKIMQRAGNFQGLLNIFIDSWKDIFADIEETENVRLALLPDEQHSPEFIFMTLPNEGIDQRCDFDWQTGINLPMAGSDRCISYEVSSVMSIQNSHYLSWQRRPKAGMICCADSSGETDPEQGAVPVLISLPDADGATKLHTAWILSHGPESYILSSVRDKLLSLGQHVALVVLKKSS